MHLLVLSAFRPVVSTHRLLSIPCLNAPFGAQRFPTVKEDGSIMEIERLNAPFGAQCFPTRHSPYASTNVVLSLNAPFGAQCFPTRALSRQVGACFLVSMHLLVLSAFRPGGGIGWRR